MNNRALSNHPADSQLSGVQSKVTKDYQGWHIPYLRIILGPPHMLPTNPSVRVSQHQHPGIL